MNFTKDLSFGKQWEVTASQLVGGNVEFAPSGRFKPYDFVADGVKYEVKADRLAYKYGGNTMFVEFECSGQPSGISTTEADFWMYFMVAPDGSYKCFKYNVEELKQECVNCVVKKGGDGWRSRGYIVPVKTSAEVRPEQGLYIRLPPPPPLSPRDQKTQANKTSPLSPLPAVLLG